MKGVLIILFSMSVGVCFGQLKHDANWVFGDSLGVNFTDNQNPIAFKAISKNAEANASISDSAGNLQLYISYNRNYNWMQTDIRDGNHNIVANGNGVNVDFSATNGAIFLPVPEKKDSIFLFHLGIYASSCDHFRCLKLYYTLIVKGNDNRWSVTQKNVLVSNETIEESIALVKHSDELNWWLIVHGQKKSSQDSTSNKYFVFDVTKSGASFHLETSVNDHTHFYSFAGELVPFRNGSYLLDAVTGASVVYIDKFDRCTGEIIAWDTLNLSLPVNQYVYSSAEINNHIYVTYSNYDNTSWGGGIKHFHMMQDSIVELPPVYQGSILSDFLSQIELAPDGNIWVNHWYMGFDSLLIDQYKRHISVIKNPGNIGSSLANYHFSLPSYSFPNIGLPNFPNYNLGPEGVFLANAGKDTTLCSNTNTTGVTIGVPLVPNVTYLWQPTTGLSVTNIAQPIANPTQSTWYYLTATDTTATTCAVNTDSMYVKVETCTGITETPTLQAKLYPNPTNGLLTVEVPQSAGGFTFRLFNLLGQQVLEYPLEHDKTTFPLDFAKGIYLYQITAHNWQVQNGKLVVGE